MAVRFTLRDRLTFGWKYVYHKTIGLLFDVRTPRLRFLAFELSYSLSKLLPRSSHIPYRIAIAYTETRRGTFCLRPGTADTVCASPAFERTDVDRLLTLIEGAVNAAKRILFLDVGAGFGTYTVTVGNRFHRYASLSIVAYEPAPESLYLLRRNVTLNGLDDRVTIVPYAACAQSASRLRLDYDPSAPGSSGITNAEILAPGHSAVPVTGVTIDETCGADLANVDVIFVKIDVEGYETEVLRGGRSLFQPEIETHFLVEDSVDDTVHRTLAESNATFVAKLSPYNSWWTYQL